MTLSRFLRDYIYIPLGGNKISFSRTYVNLLVTFVIGGLWHGAGWTFIFWGFLHGMALIIHRVWSTLGFKMWTWLAWFITFNFVNVAWVFFRAKEWDDAVRVLKGMIGVCGLGIKSIVIYKFLIVGLFFILLVSLFTKNSIEQVKNFKTDIKTVVFISLLFSISMIFLTRVSEFLYFNF